MKKLLLIVLILVITLQLSQMATSSGRESKNRIKDVTRSHITEVICPGEKYKCPDGTTCCSLNSQNKPFEAEKTESQMDTEYGCCPLENAVCCADHVHCCPHDMECNLREETCDRKKGNKYKTAWNNVLNW